MTCTALTLRKTETPKTISTFGISHLMRTYTVQTAECLPFAPFPEDCTLVKEWDALTSLQPLHPNSRIWWATEESVLSALCGLDCDELVGCLGSWGLEPCGTHEGSALELTLHMVQHGTCDHVTDMGSHTLLYPRKDLRDPIALLHF